MKHEPGPINLGVALAWFLVGLVLGSVLLMAMTVVANAKTPAKPLAYHLTVDYVIDGDTFAFVRPKTLPPWVVDHVRISGIDTPEHVMPPAQAACEVALGIHASEVASTILHHGDAVTGTWDGHSQEKYGRLLGTVTLADGTDYGSEMVKRGVARVYTAADLKKQPWC